MKRNGIIGAIAGDIIGSCFEFNPVKFKNFELFNTESTFTDDSVMTLAVASWIMDGKTTPLYVYMQEHFMLYPMRGYGSHFREFLLEDTYPGPYNSFGNGSAMRVSPVGYVANTLDECLALAEETAVVSHNHPEGIKGAQATAASIFLARNGKNKNEIKKYIEDTFNYDLSKNIEDIKPGYVFHVDCQESVPESIMCYLQSNSWEDTVRNAVSFGGDADTMACIAGSIAAATPGMEVPEEIADRCFWILDSHLRHELNLFDDFV